MISDLLIPELQQRFPGRGLRVGSPPEACAVFPSAHPEVGDVVIQDDGTEVTVCLGNFTHSHFANYEDTLTQEQKVEQITADVVAFLEDLFADRVVLWGSRRGAGGWRSRDDEAKHSNYVVEYVWSGPLSSSRTSIAQVDALSGARGQSASIGASASRRGKMAKGIRRSIALVIACSLAGYLSFWLPWQMAIQSGATYASNPVDGMQPITILMLLLIGFLSALFAPKRFWLGGVSAIALLPILAVVEMIRDPSTHNLFPIEFLIYGFLTLPGILGGYLATKVFASIE